MRHRNHRDSRVEQTSATIANQMTPTACAQLNIASTLTLVEPFRAASCRAISTTTINRLIPGTDTQTPSEEPSNPSVICDHPCGGNGAHQSPP